MPSHARHLALLLVLALAGALVPGAARGIGVSAEQKISALEGGLEEVLVRNDFFGGGVAGIGDLDGDGVGDLAVGQTEGNHGSGRVRILFLHPDGTVNASRSIGSGGEGGFTEVLDRDDRFGSSLASLGDLDGDGVGDLAVGATGDDDGGSSRGAVYILFLNPDGTVKAHQKISDTQGGLGGALRGAWFGTAVESLGDLDGDGVVDIAVGEPLDRDGGLQHGAVWILFLNDDGTVKAHQKISELEGGFGGALDDRDNFGTALAALRPFSADTGIVLAVGANRGTSVDDETGAVWLLALANDGTVRWEQKIAPGVGGFVGELPGDAHLGTAAASLGDLDGNGVADLAVSAPDGGGFEEPPGSLWLLLLNADGTVGSQLEVTEGAGGFGGDLHLSDFFGASVDDLGDLDGDGVLDLAVGAIRDDDGDFEAGAVWVLFLEDSPPVCGDGALGPGEECDDGNLRDGDLCSASCEAESFLALVGVARGGSLSLAIEGVPVAVESFPGESAAVVVAALAAAANADPALAALGVGALARDGFLGTNGALGPLTLDDEGLTRRPHALELFGAPRGGAVEILVEGIAVSVTTQILDTPSDVAFALARAIDLEPGLWSMGVVAFAEGNRLVTNGGVEVGAISDAGLQAASEVPGVTLLAFDGDPTPAGGFYDFDDDSVVLRPSRALMDDAGDVFFRTAIADGDVPDALFRASGDEVRPLVRPGDAAPDTGGGVFSGFQYDPSGYGYVGAVTAVSGGGELAFFANLAGSSSPWGAFASDGITTRAIALALEPVPGLPGASWLYTLPLALNDAGDAILAANLLDFRLGLFRVEGVDVSAIAFQGDEAPGTGGGSFDLALPLGYALSDSGQVVFSASVYGSAVNEGIFRWRDGALEPLLLAGAPVPGIDAVFACTPGDFGCLEFAFGEIRANESGMIVFRGNYREAATGFYRAGIFVFEDGVLSPVALEGDPAPGSGLPFDHFQQGAPALNDAGDLAFIASARAPGPGPAGRAGIFARPAGGALEARALGGTPAPGTGGQLIESFATPVGMDATGRRLSALVNRTALYRFTKNAAPRADAGPDQVLECSSPAGAMAMLDGSGSGDPDGDALAFTWTGPFAPTHGVSPTVPVPLGRSTLALEVADGFGGSSRDQLEVSVLDSTPPRVSAALEPVAGGLEDRGGRGGGRPDSAGAFAARIACSDTCDASPRVSATLNGIAVEDGDVIQAGVDGARPGLLQVECADASGNATSTAAKPGRRPR